jgi:N-acetyl-alpha-D-glucosaminyl L-malate synthase BshA
MNATKYRIGMTSFAAQGGSGVVASELGLALASRGHEVHFIANALPVRLREFEPKVFFHEVQTVQYPAFPHAPYTLALATKMTEVARYHDLEILHVHYAIPHAASAYLAQKMLAPSGIKVVTTLHGTDITLVGQEPSFWPLTQFLIEQSDVVTAVSHDLAQQTRQIFRTDREIRVIYNFVDPGHFRPRPDLKRNNPLAPAGEKVLLHASNLRPVKNVETVVRVFARVVAEVKCRLVIVGDGPERGPAERLAEKMGVCDRVTFLGARESMEELMAMADVLLLPSEHESFGLVALEAMSAQTPVVASKRGGLPELIEDGETGFLHEPEDIEGQSASVLRLLRDEALAKKMGERAREVAKERFCTDCILDSYLDMYHEIRDGSSSAG